MAITDEVRRVLDEHGRLGLEVAGLGEDDDLFRAGLTSHAVVSVMLALEETFAVEFPEHLVRRGTFESVGAIRRALTELQTTTPGP
jgi:acyl carrier protein